MGCQQSAGEAGKQQKGSSNSFETPETVRGCDVVEEPLEKAEKHVEQACRFLKEALPDDPLTLTFQHGLACLLKRQSKLKVAEEMFRQVHRSRLNLLGNEHPDTVDSEFNLACVHNSQGNVDEAVQHLQRPLAFYEARALTCKDVLSSVPGKATKATFECANTLAGTPTHIILRPSFGNADRDSEELSVEQRTETRNPLPCLLIHRVLEEAKLDRPPPRTLDNVTEVTKSLISQGNLDEAVVLSMTALSDFGEHPRMLRTVNNVARELEKNFEQKTDLGDRGDMKKAEELFKHIYDSREKVLGEQHPDTLQSLYSLALNLQKQGKHREAETRFKSAVKHAQTVAEEFRIRALVWKNQWARSLQDLGKLEEAENIFRESCSGLKEALKQDSPRVLTSVRNLARSLQKKGQQKRDLESLEEAKKLFAQVYDARVQNLGNEHEDTKRSGKDLKYVQDDIEKQRSEFQVSVGHRGTANASHQ